MNKFIELKEPCKSMIEKGECLGCNALEDPDFTSNPNCIHVKKIQKEKAKKWSGNQLKIF